MKSGGSRTDNRNFLCARYFESDRNFFLFERRENADAGELYLKTESGSVSGTVLTEKVFLTETVSGTVNVPKTAKGGKCEIITKYGDVDISVK